MPVPLPNLLLEGESTVVCRVLATGFPKSDHVSNSNTIAHVIAFGKELCKLLHYLMWACYFYVEGVASRSQATRPIIFTDTCLIYRLIQ